MDREEKEIQGEVPGIYLSEHQMNNMKMERIVVSNPAIIKILEGTQLSEKAQEEAVNDLVDRTEDWLDMENEDQIAKIKVVLTQESVVEFLRHQGTIRDKVDVLQVGIDDEGSVVIEAYYTSLNREQRRAAEKAMSEEDKRRMEKAVNILGSNDNLVDLAQKKMEKLKKEGKKFRGKKL